MNTARIAQKIKIKKIKKEFHVAQIRDTVLVVTIITESLVKYCISKVKI